jgi:two-component system sensor histidine kinase MprB
VVWYLALRGTLVSASASVAETVANELRPAARSSIEQYGGLTQNLYQPAGVVVEAVPSTGGVLQVPGASQLVVQPGDLRPTVDGSTVSRVGTDVTGTHYVMVSVPLGLEGYVLVVARPLAPIESILAAERWILLGVGASALTAAALIGGLVARSAMRPVHQLTAAVQHVAKTTDFQPVSIPRASSDLAALATAFNEMLQSLATMRERQTRLVADAGHELRTPLTSMTTNIDLLISDVRAGYLSPAQKSCILADVHTQLGELSSLTCDLVRLTRDDATTPHEVVDLRVVVASAVDRVRRRTVGQDIDLSMEEFYVVGDAESLERAVINLLDNAVKWSPPAGTIRVRLEGNRVSVADSGPGIPDADLPYVFDRFFRGETARHTPGTGLGLSIVAKAMEEHGGTVTASRSDDGGAELTLQLPGVRTADAVTDTCVGRPGWQRTIA